jgi:hypothetical protein
MKGEATSGSTVACPHLISQRPLQPGSGSFASDKGVLLFTLPACILVKCFLVIYGRVDEANKENDRVVFS